MRNATSRSGIERSPRARQEGPAVHAAVPADVQRGSVPAGLREHLLQRRGDDAGGQRGNCRRHVRGKDRTDYRADAAREVPVLAGTTRLHSEKERECAMRRIVVSPVKRAEMRGDISGSDALPEFERTHGTIAWQKTGGRVQVSGTARREIRVILVKAILPES